MRIHRMYGFGVLLKAWDWPRGMPKLVQLLPARCFARYTICPTRTHIAGHVLDDLSESIVGRCRLMKGLFCVNLSEGVIGKLHDAPELS